MLCVFSAVFFLNYPILFYNSTMPISFLQIIEHKASQIFQRMHSISVWGCCYSCLWWIFIFFLINVLLCQCCKNMLLLLSSKQILVKEECFLSPWGGHWARSRAVFGCHTWERSWEVRDAAHHPTMHRTAPTSKNNLSRMSVLERWRNIELKILVLLLFIAVSRLSPMPGMRAHCCHWISAPFSSV